MKPLKTFHARTLSQWRQWLARHHDSESEIWLVFYKQPTARASVGYEEAVNEALCVGWIDSLIKRLDDVRYARKFTPRRASSRWSPSNRRRYARLLALGRLTPAGQKLAPTKENVYPPKPVRRARRVPRYIQSALKQSPAAAKYFASLAPSYRRLYVGWIDSAKQQETKLRRLQVAIALLAEGRKLGLK